jgi:hypothetical protein
VLFGQLSRGFGAHPEFAFQGLELALLELENLGNGASAFKSGASLLEKVLLHWQKEH